jgi:NADPH:quinone reductase-like Zn-dependent oxidoreductase
MRELTQMFASGVIRPYIGARFALADTAAALRHVADRKAIGKVLIDVTG